MYKIYCWEENSRSIYPLFIFSAFVIPRIGEKICGPDGNACLITDVIYNTSDDTEKAQIISVDLQVYPLLTSNKIKRSNIK